MERKKHCWGKERKKSMKINSPSSIPAKNRKCLSGIEGKAFQMGYKQML